MEGIFPGTYALSVEPYAYTATLDIGDKDMRWDIDLSEIAEVLVWGIDDENHSVEGATALWRRDTPPEPSNWRVAASSGEAAYRLLAMPGRISVQIIGKNARGNLTQEVYPGPNDLAVPMRLFESAEIQISLNDLDAEVSVPPSFWSAIVVSGVEHEGMVLERRLTGTGDGKGTSVEVSQATLRVDRVGEYRLAFPSIEGYEPIEAKTVRIGKERQAVLELPLVRRPTLVPASR